MEAGSGLHLRPLNSRGSLGPDPAGVTRSLFDTINQKTILNLQKVPETQRLQDGEWTLCNDSDTGLPTGRVRIQLSSKVQVDMIKKVADQQVVLVGGQPLPISINNLQCTPLPKCQGNGRGGL